MAPDIISAMNKMYIEQANNTASGQGAIRNPDAGHAMVVDAKVDMIAVQLSHPATGGASGVLVPGNSPYWIDRRRLASGGYKNYLFNQHVK